MRIDHSDTKKNQYTKAVKILLNADDGKYHDYTDIKKKTGSKIFMDGYRLMVGNVVYIPEVKKSTRSPEVQKAIEDCANQMSAMNEAKRKKYKNKKDPISSSI